MSAPLALFGALLLALLGRAGATLQLGSEVLRALPGIHLRETARTAVKHGLGSIGLAALVATCTGGIIVLETASYTVKFGMRDVLGGMAGISILREFSPLMMGFVLAGWVGASQAAEMANLVLGGQVASLRGLGIDPAEVLYAPRVVGTLLAMAVLCLVADLFALGGGALAGWGLLGIPPDVFFRSFGEILAPRDIGEGLAKSCSYALALSLLAIVEGLRVRGGAREVGAAVAASVVQGVLAIAVLDAVLTALIGGGL